MGLHCLAVRQTVIRAAERCCAPGPRSRGGSRRPHVGRHRDIVRLPGFEFGILHPESAYREALVARFPQQERAIGHWFESCDAARRTAMQLFASHAMPHWVAWALSLWRGADAEHWTRRTLADELALISDPELRAVLGARWADYGAPPAQAPFAMHALVTGAYNGGAYYPIGGPARFAQCLQPVIEAAGGALSLGCDVQRITTEGGRVSGVVYAMGGEQHVASSPRLISAMGVGNTVACLAPDVAAGWQQTIQALAPGLSCISLFVGLEGDLRAAGASSANHWIFEGDAIGSLWQRPADEDAPGIFVAFPSLKDPESRGRPTAELVAMVDPHVFAPWLARPDGERPQDYLALEARIEERLLSQFLRHFPALKPMLRFHELSTPLTQRRYVRSPGGAMYGIEMSAGRLTSPALHVRTPLPGLLLAGQDVVSPGVQGAFMGGLLAAASLEPALWASLGR
ncbi:Phytoene dehydrogenase-related protein [Variovorax sp. HW608]|nr:Phytoene dehydrogenase-related protein [Variovorax sp. HW608]